MQEKLEKQYFLSLFQLQQNQSMDKADKFSTEVKMLRSENALLQDELRRAKVPSIYYVGTHKGGGGAMVLKNVNFCLLSIYKLGL